MIIDAKIRNKNLEYNINRAAAKISAIFSNKIENYEYLAGEKIPPDQSK